MSGVTDQRVAVHSFVETSSRMPARHLQSVMQCLERLVSAVLNSRNDFFGLQLVLAELHMIHRAMPVPQLDIALDTVNTLKNNERRLRNQDNRTTLFDAVLEGVAISRDLDGYFDRVQMRGALKHLILIITHGVDDGSAASMEDARTALDSELHRDDLLFVFLNLGTLAAHRRLMSQLGQGRNRRYLFASSLGGLHASFERVKQLCSAAHRGAAYPLAPPPRVRLECVVETTRGVPPAALEAVAAALEHQLQATLTERAHVFGLTALHGAGVARAVAPMPRDKVDVPRAMAALRFDGNDHNGAKAPLLDSFKGALDACLGPTNPESDPETVFRNVVLLVVDGAQDNQSVVAVDPFISFFSSGLLPDLTVVVVTTGTAPAREELFDTLAAAHPHVFALHCGGLLDNVVQSLDFLNSVLVAVKSGKALPPPPQLEPAEAILAVAPEPHPGFSQENFSPYQNYHQPPIHNPQIEGGDSVLLVELMARRDNLQREMFDAETMATSCAGIAAAVVGAAPFDADGMLLPPGWERRSQPNGPDFYIDHANRVTSWHHPYDPHNEATLGLRLDMQRQALEEKARMDASKTNLLHELVHVLTLVDQERAAQVARLAHAHAHAASIRLPAPQYVPAPQQPPPTYSPQQQPPKSWSAVAPAAAPAPAPALALALALAPASVAAPPGRAAAAASMGRAQQDEEDDDDDQGLERGRDEAGVRDGFSAASLQHPKILAAISELSAQFPSKQKVDLFGYRFGNEGMVALLPAISVNKKITELQLHGNEFSAKSISLLASVLKTDRVLRTLNLAANPFGDDGFLTLAQALFSNRTLRDLNVSNTGLTGVSAATVVSLLRKNAVLHRLHLHKNYIGDAGALEIIAVVGAGNSTLTVLNLHQNLLTSKVDAAVDAAYERYPDAHINVVEPAKTARQGGQASSLAAAHSASASVSSALATAAAAAASLTSVSVVIAALETDSVEDLILGHLSLTDADIQKVAKVIPRAQSFRSLDIEKSTILTSGARALGKALVGHASLRKFVAAKSSLGSVGLGALVPGLSTCSRLNDLYLSNSELRASAGASIATIMRECKFLKSIMLNYNKLNDEGAKAIADALPYTRHLWRIEIKENGLTDVGARAFLDNLVKCDVFKLSVLSLDGNDVSKSVLQRIDEIKAPRL